MQNQLSEVAARASDRAISAVENLILNLSMRLAMLRNTIAAITLAAYERPDFESSGCIAVAAGLGCIAAGCFEVGCVDTVHRGIGRFAAVRFAVVRFDTDSVPPDIGEYSEERRVGVVPVRCFWSVVRRFCGTNWSAGDWRPADCKTAGWG